ncbi:MAG: aspartyl protease family protein [Cyanobacteriota bacterium]
MASTVTGPHPEGATPADAMGLQPLTVLIAALLLAAVPARAALVQLEGMRLPEPRVRGAANVPYDRPADGDTPIVSLTTPDGAVLRLLLDSGASVSLVTERLVQRLGLPVSPLPPGALRLAGAGAGCQDLRPGRVQLPQLTVGGMQIDGLEALVMPALGIPPGSDGVLGAPLFRQLPLLVDPVGRRLRLGPDLDRAGVAPAGATRLPLRWRHAVPLLELQDSRGTQGSALLDTGAEGLFVSRNLAARLRPQGPVQALRIAGFCGDESALQMDLEGLQLAGTPVGKRSMIVTDSGILAALEVEAVVGQPLLRDRRQLWLLNREQPVLLLW